MESCGFPAIDPAAHWSLSFDTFFSNYALFVDSISQVLTTADVLAMNDHDALARRALRVAAAVRSAMLAADITVAYDIATMWEGFGA